MAQTAIIRTSDRASFKRCRRKWAFSSHLRHNRTQSESAEYLWLGTGGHYALEDYHGYNYYKSPVEAFRAYVTAQKKWAHANPGVELPVGIDEQTTLGEGLLEYYLIWLQNRDPLKTLWVDGVPQVEVKCTCVVPYTNEHYDKVVYQATLDRVVDLNGDLWIVDYKFYNRDWTSNLDFDQQASAYCWLGTVLYDRPVKGIIFQKHFKRLPKAPRVLQSGKISSDKSQDTTYHMYKEALENLYGDVARAPLANRKCLEDLMLEEGDERDSFIQRVRTTRSQAQAEATGAAILMELEDMLNPDLPLYPNGTKDCDWDCSFKDVCLFMDMGLDWQDVLEQTTVSRQLEVDDGWRNYLPHLETEG